MKFVFTDKKVNLPNKVHAYAEKKVGKLDRYFKADAEAAVVGRLDLTIQAARPQKVVSLPMDKEFRGELAASRKKKAEAGDEFLAAKAESALTKLRAMNG